MRGKVDTALTELINYNLGAAEASNLNNEQEYATMSIIMLIIICTGVFLAILLGFIVSNLISKPLVHITQVAEKLSMGDINVMIDIKSRDEVGSLANSFEKMIVNIREQAMAVEKIAEGDLTIHVIPKSENDLLGIKLSEMIEKNNLILSNIDAAAEQVANGSKQVSDSSIALSQGATEQASAIEELTASIEEISSQTRLNAESANEANKLAEVAKENAVEGNKQMSDMLKAMEDINESSGNISRIIKVIDEIAFQTNIAQCSS